MPHLSALLGFALVSFGMVLTPGPNMIYLISRSICQGRAAGLISLGGVALGFVVYMLCAAFGITALLLAVPFAYDALRFGGTLYLVWAAWEAVKAGRTFAVPGAGSARRQPAQAVHDGLCDQSAESENR